MPSSARGSGEMHRLGDAVEVKLIEAVPLAGALRFELLSEGRVLPRKDRPAAPRAAVQRRPRQRPPQEGRAPALGASRTRTAATGGRDKLARLAPLIVASSAT